MGYSGVWGTPGMYSERVDCAYVHVRNQVAEDLGSWVLTVDTD